MTEESLKNFIRDKVADYKVPDIIVIVKELRMTASGKISKVKLQEVLKEKLAHSIEITETVGVASVALNFIISKPYVRHL